MYAQGGNSVGFGSVVVQQRPILDYFQSPTPIYNHYIQIQVTILIVAPFYAKVLHN